TQRVQGSVGDDQQARFSGQRLLGWCYQQAIEGQRRAEVGGIEPAAIRPERRLHLVRQRLKTGRGSREIEAGQALPRDHEQVTGLFANGVLEQGCLMVEQRLNLGEVYQLLVGGGERRSLAAADLLVNEPALALGLAKGCFELLGRRCAR